MSAPQSTPPVDSEAYPMLPIQTPKKKSFFARHKILTVIGALIVLGGVAKMASGGSDAPATTSTGSTASQESTVEPESDALPGIGVAVQDGKFEFTVTGVEPGIARVGTDVVGQDAQGQYVFVHVTITNVGDKAQLFAASAQKLFDTADREHSADGTAAIYLDDSTGLLAEINPGNTVEGTLVFDVPADAVPASIELHDSMFSGGTTISLG